MIGSNDGNLLTLIPAIAGTWTFVPLGDRSMASNEEILTRYLLLCRLQGRNWQDVEKELRSDSRLHPNAFTLAYILVMQSRIFPETVKTANTIWNKIDLPGDFKDRKLDYLIESQADSVPVFPGLSEPVASLYQNSEWRVFRVPQR